MNSNKIIRMMSLSAVSALFLTACNNSSPKMDEQPAATPETATTGMKIAYVEVDSLMSQYNFCKDYSLILQKRATMPAIPSIKKDNNCRLPCRTSNRK